ncbi:GAS2-like protein 1 [Dasypus novemcinctus]|uniref:GAS2-like protein 1 n=1 Tax=Dasypus novemcinctus TaxID=9361 RepID=UPI00265F6ED7|nr:GAS2-like protein 1 [Dasypus novemcinctus]
MADPVAGIAGSAAKSVRPFRSSEAYVEAMKEDLAEWLNALYSLGLPGGGDGFLAGLATGTTLCQHANAVTAAARALAAARPARGVAFQTHSAAPGSFVARDNVATFIGWCRGELGVPEVLMFETEDLVLRKNEKSVVLCLLEVARRGARLGLLAPRLVQFEQEIERELSAAPPAPGAPATGEDPAEASAAPGAPTRGPRMTPSDLRNLDELVREILGRCTCPDQFPMIKVSEGKYRVGDSSLLIFVRVLRSHVMVRVGGGWDTLEHYLDKHDPCRCSSTAHRPPQPRARTFSPQRGSPTPSPRAGSPAPGGERRCSRPEVTPISLRSSKEGSETPLRPRDQLPPHPRSRRYSGDSDSSASSAQSGPLGGPRSEDTGTGPRKERPSRRLTTGTPASPRRPPAPRSQSRDRLDRGRPRGALGGRGSQLPAPSPTRRARSQSREEQGVLLVRRDRDGQHSWVPRGRGSGGSGRSTPQTPRARSPAARRPSRPSSPRPDLGTPASVFRTPLQLDPQQEQQLFQRLEEEFLANARALEAAAAGGNPAGPVPDPARAPDPPAPDSAYCSSSSSSSSLSFLGGKCGPPGDPARTANGLPGPRGPALSSSSDEGSSCPGGGVPPDALGSSLTGLEPSQTWARGRMDTQPDRKPSRIPTPRAPRRPPGPTEPGAWHAMHSVSPRAEPDSWM